MPICTEKAFMDQSKKAQRKNIDKRLDIRDRPNFVFFFVFGTEKCVYKIFRPFIFPPKKTHIFSMHFIFRYKYGRENNRNSECINSADG